MALEVILFFPLPSTTSKSRHTLPNVYWMGQEGERTLFIAFHSSILFVETIRDTRKEGLVAFALHLSCLKISVLTDNL